MKKWIPKNLATNVEYPAITADEKTKWENDKQMKGKYEFREIEVADEKPASLPTAVKKVETEKKDGE